MSTTKTRIWRWYLGQAPRDKPGEMADLIKEALVAAAERALHTEWHGDAPWAEKVEACVSAGVARLEAATQEGGSDDAFKAGRADE